MTTQKIIDILYKRLSGTPLSAGETEFLQRWIEADPQKRQQLVERLSDTESVADGYRLRSRIDTSRPMADMETRLGIRRHTPRKRLFSRLSAATPWMVAASITILLSAATIFYMRRPAPAADITASGAASTGQMPLRIENLTPGGSQAIITTASGDTIHVSDASSSRSRLAKAASAGPLQLEVPRGSEFVVTLEDSTKVWLNSESKLIYPSHFGADSRIVQLTGEAYFEVTHNDHAPFIVESAGQRVKVYGTEFNIRSYPDDPVTYTSLSSGSISLSPASGGGEIFLSPGKQALLTKATSRASIRDIDIERVTAWRHGRFVFEEQSLEQIMKDLSRWYDFDYEFADTEAAETIFMGSIPRYSNFKTAIAILEKAGGLAFSVKDDRIVISSRRRQ